MIAKLTGTVLLSNPLVLEVNNIGYEVFVAKNMQLPKIGETLSLWIYHKIESQELFGFLDSAVRECFTKLLNVPGVGAKAALSILSTLSPSELALAIAQDDYKAISAADGIGGKISKRIITELKDKDIAPTNGVLGDIVKGLINLGYDRSKSSLAADFALKELGQDSDFAALFRLSIQRIANV